MATHRHVCATNQPMPAIAKAHAQQHTSNSNSNVQPTAITTTTCNLLPVWIEISQAYYRNGTLVTTYDPLPAHVADNLI
eukprot:CAMPEP_0203772466 /NCGR_PEP_ID=MMETSP0099_2-20121227/4056_1 /ASSEMBLY_ACC=CAM_ASM_000209 /TAXON_ID=96639 /ORGANISM=" , Strain NY0313808BC1" /LENGTH=78 /DNA_ID=CAMNT_0050670065 /DNA_START=616 /DNA_END=849 /DNA_ORIENTATION=-